MATAKYGKGTVYAMVDPWLYNEYTDRPQASRRLRQLCRRQRARPLGSTRSSPTLINSARLPHN